MARPDLARLIALEADLITKWEAKLALPRRTNWPTSRFWTGKWGGIQARERKNTGNDPSKSTSVRALGLGWTFMSSRGAL